MTAKKKNRPGTFKKGDPRINRKGRPKSFDALRELALQIGHEEAKKGDKCIVINGRKVTITEQILRQWATSRNPILQKAFIEIAYGKVPDRVELGGSLDFNIGEWKILADKQLADIATIEEEA